MNVRGIGRLRRVARRVRNVFAPRAIILLYHRVVELALDPQLLCVSRRNFTDHLQVVRERGRALQLQALGEALGHRSRGGCLIIFSFDDGYADNLYHAKPLLERYDIPATMFVTTGHLGSKREFWYDGLERIFLQPGPLPETLQLKIDGHCYQWELDSPVDGVEELDRTFREWNIFRKDNPTARHRLYRSLFHILQPLPDEERQQIMGQLAAWAGFETVPRPTHRTLSPEELIQLTHGGLIEIGSHTVSHPLLSALPRTAQVDEICRSKSDLEEMLGEPIVSFAYPFGGRSHYTDETVAVVREVGFEWACSNFAGLISASTDRWQLPRFMIPDWDGEQFARALHSWMSD